MRHLLIIGAQRCGTTYLQSLLEDHPEIAMARPARPEPKVFCDPGASARGARWYRDTYFSHAEPQQLLGEKSTSYLEDGTAAVRAEAMLGQAHIVVMLRDPVQRAVSNWRFSTEHGLETRSLETALRENLSHATPWDRERTSVSPFAYLERGRYMDYLTPWLATFPDTMHIVLLPELVADDSALESLFKSIGVAPEHRTERSDNPVNFSEGEAPALSQDLQATLDAYFEASNRALIDHIGRPLPWC